MATTLDEVGEYLKRDGWHFLIDADTQLLRCRRRRRGVRHDVEIRVGEQGDCLHLRVPRVVSLGNSPHAGLLLERILELHYQIKIGRFGLAAVDGEIDCEVILPLEDARLTYRQFRRCLSTLVMLADQQRPRFEAILASGEDPARHEEEQFDEFLDQLAEAFGVPREELLSRLDDPTSEGDR